MKFAVLPPGAPPTDQSIAAGPLLPGWQLAFTLVDSKPIEDLARQRMVSYLWGGYLAIAAVVLLGLLVGQSFRRQWRLAHLKTDLAAAVSHELKTPLASMRLLVDSLLEDEIPNPAKTRDYLQLIAGENLRLTHLIGNFLTFSRIERHRHKFAFAEVKPSGILESAVQTIQERFPSEEWNLEVDIASNLPRIYADEDSIVTVLLNLLDNARKYTPQKKRISLRAYSETGRVIFAVRDNGIGIERREQKRIFRRFYQIDRRLARETGGCGLGLSIVQFIVRAHRGSVRVESQAGEGSTFIVSLPSIREARGKAA
ncbi:MAG TPA: HAMP domain-containing sensor histidine kinase [Bryobacteraceae bacterium]|nr:HAMP domain-containing sensor histidine kinase [Bryobacteraceae bacterium]